jgi:hypothetical protein
VIAKYQIAIFGPGAPAHRPKLRRTLRKRLRELGDSLIDFVAVLNAPQVVGCDPRAPIVGVYFGGAGATAMDEEAAKALVDSSAVVLPVVGDLATFNQDVPAVLRPINGIALDKADPRLEAITNLILENLGLMRRSRRLFISYRRSDSTEVALQLRHALDARGYDVFLDTHSVPRGDAFQEVLWQRLADSDLMVILDSPEFLESRWTQAELAQASAMSVGMLQVVWPKAKPARYSDLCNRLYLEAADFGGASLEASAVERIAVEAERLRVRSVAARHNNLVREFCDGAALAGLTTVVQPDRYVLATLPDGRKIAAIPVIGVPDALQYHDINNRFPAGPSLSYAMLLYDNRGLRPAWTTFLEWLDGFLPVKAVRITRAAEKLRSA